MNVAGSSSIALPPRIRDFIAAPHFGSVATVDADGSPRQAIIWYLPDGDELVVNSRVGRRWPTNLLRDPRVYVAVFDERSGAVVLFDLLAAQGLDAAGQLGLGVAKVLELSAAAREPTAARSLRGAS